VAHSVEQNLTQWPIVRKALEVEVLGELESIFDTVPLRMGKQGCLSIFYRAQTLNLLKRFSNK
jgi:hypothetical protein